MSDARRAGWAALVAVAGGAAACAAPGSDPQRALDDYGRALERRDGDAIARRSAPSLADAATPEALERFLEKNPATAERAAAAARTPARSVELRATVVTTEGARFELVQGRDGDWRVAEGPLPLPRLDTPEHALQTFFFAARGHLELLRETMPDEERARFASDAALARHLYASTERIEAARAGLEPIRAGQACIDGDVARIGWGEGRAVRLVRQGGTWRVADLE